MEAVHGKTIAFQEGVFGNKSCKETSIRSRYYEIGSSFSTVSLKQKQAKPDFKINLTSSTFTYLH